MSSQPATPDARRLLIQSLSSAAQCDQGTVRSIRECLGEFRVSKNDSKLSSRDGTTRTAAAAPPTGRGKTVTVKIMQDSRTTLSEHDRTKLATLVINTVLDTLGKLVKTGIRPTKAAEQLRQPSAQPSLGTGGSKPKKPQALNERSTNQASPTPKSTIPKPIGPSTQDTPSYLNIKAIAECGHAAFAFLRARTPIGESWQLEQGMVAFTGQLIAMQLANLAASELKALKWRLNHADRISSGPMRPKQSGVESSENSRETLVTLFDIHEPGDDPLKLAIIVSHHLAVVRALGLSNRSAEIDAALPILSSLSTTSPIKTILKLSEQTGDRVRAGTQLQALLTAIMSLGSKATEGSSQSTKHLRAESCFGIQNLALRLKVISMRLVQCQAPIEEAIMKPFRRFLSAFVHNCKDGPVATYSCATEAFKDLTTELKATHNGRNFHVDESSTVLSGVRSTIIGLAVNAGLNDEALQLIDEALRVCGGQSLPRPRYTALLLQRASIELEVMLLQQKADASEHLEKVLEMIQKDALSLLQVDNATPLLLALCKIASELYRSLGLHAHQQSQTFRHCDELCRKIISSCLPVVTSMLHDDINEWSPAGAAKTDRRKRDLHQLAAACTQYVVVRALHVQETALDPSKLSSILNDLSSCTSLCTLLEKGTPPSNQTESSSNTTSVCSLSSISNAYLALHLISGRLAPDRAIVILEAACHVLRSGSDVAKRSGKLASKLARLGRKLRDAGHTSKAMSAFMEAITTHLEVQSTGPGSDDQATSHATMSSRDVLSEILEDALELEARQETVIPQSRGFLNIASLPTHLEILLLELQLDILSRWTCSNRLSSYATSTLPELCTRLLQTHEDFSSVVVRGQTYVRISKLVFDDQGRWTPDFCEVLDMATLKALNDLRPLFQVTDVTHWSVNASLQTVLAFRQPKLDSRHIEEALKSWRQAIDLNRQSSDILPNSAALLGHLESYLGMMGKQWLQLTASCLKADMLSITNDNHSDAMVISLMETGLQHLGLGSTDAACWYLSKAQEQTRHGSEASILLDLAYAAYYLELHDTGQCFELLERVRNNESWETIDTTKPAPSQSATRRIQRGLIETDYHHLRSRLAALLGRQEAAVAHSRRERALLQSFWVHSGQQWGLNNTHEQPQDSCVANAVLRSIPRDAVVQGAIDPSEMLGQPSLPGARLGASSLGVSHLLPRLAKACAHSATLATFHGLFQVASAHLDQLRDICNSPNLARIRGDFLVQRGGFLTRSGSPKGGLRLLNDATQLYETMDPQPQMVHHQHALGRTYHLRQEWPQELSAYKEAYTVIRGLCCRPKDGPLSAKYLGAPTERKGDIERTAEQQAPKHDRKHTKRRPTIKSVSKARGKVTISSEVPKSRPSSSGEPDKSPFFTHEEVHLRCFEAESLLAQNNLSTCRTVLTKLPAGPFDARVADRLTVAWSLLWTAEAISTMSHDAVFSMLTESSISSPSYLEPKQQELANGMSRMTLGSPKKKTAKLAKTTTKQMLGKEYESADLLRQIVVEVHKRSDSLISTLPLVDLKRLCFTVASAAMMLSHVDREGDLSLAHAQTTAFWLSLPSNSAANRDRSMLLGEACTRPGVEPDIREVDRAEQSQPARTLSHVHTELIESLPKDWNVVAMSLDPSCEHLYVTRYQAGCDPFVARLPLSRQSDDTEDEDHFTFEDALAELSDIITTSDEAVHAARDDPQRMKVKGASSQWWASREALDERLQNLLTNMENMWLGGFRGLFPRHSSAEHALERFRFCFENVLEKHLPSRQKARQRAGTTKVALHPDVFELFIGLDGIDEHESEVDEALTDLLYYVVDILQFQGEANAYDEIDFDSMIVEVHSALEAYHESKNSDPAASRAMHTILVLDKNLHAFPWESLPCLRHQPVSRVHSIVDLHERLKTMKQRATTKTADPRLEAQRDHGTYILNPGQDLGSTQTRFENVLSTLSSGPLSWSGIVARAPSEQEFISGLEPDASQGKATSSNRVFVYIGHGSGEQYVRNRKIKRLRFSHMTASPSQTDQSQKVNLGEASMNPAVSVALLFGCSSASLTLHSEFEPDGTPKSYMAAGCPALLGSLWDVTDGDIDRFAGSVLERWGLIEKGSFAAQEATTVAKGKKQAKSKVPPKTPAKEQDVGQMSLVEAVARSRDECYLKYLNGAAMVVYGIPVYLEYKTEMK